MLGKKCKKKKKIKSVSLGQAEVLWNKILVTVVREKGKQIVKGVKKAVKLKKGVLLYRFVCTKNGIVDVQSSG